MRELLRRKCENTRKIARLGEGWAGLPMGRELDHSKIFRGQADVEAAG